jgi:hypothetical protein
VVAAVSSGGGGDTAQMTGDTKLDPVGTEIPKGKGEPPRSQRSVVVATGTTRIAGPWQIEIQPSELLKYKGEVIQPAGLTCVWLYLLDPPAMPGMRGPTGSGYCGDQPRTPGFTRGQANVAGRGLDPDGKHQKTRQVLIYGRAPERAEYIRLTVPRGLRMQGPVHDGPKNMRGDYYLVAVPPHIGNGARINWLDKNKRPGSRGTPLLPPVTGKVRR